MTRLRAFHRYLQARREFFRCSLMYARQAGSHAKCQGWRSDMMKQARKMLNAQRTMRTGRAI